MRFTRVGSSESRGAAAGPAIVALLLGVAGCPQASPPDGPAPALDLTPVPPLVDLAAPDAALDLAPPPPWSALCGASGWCWDNPRPQGNSLRGLFSDPAGHLIAVGELGTILRWDGRAWSLPESGTTAHLNAVHGRAFDDLFAVGEGGVALRGDGVTWRTLSTGTTRRLNGVYQAAADDAWAVGRQGTVLRFTGAAWQDYPGLTPQELFAASGSGPADVWAAGDQGALLRWDGKAWAAVSTAVQETLYATWSSSAQDHWAAGGAVLRVPAGKVGSFPQGWLPFRALWGTSAIDVFAAGPEGVYNFDGQSWTEALHLPNSTTLPLFTALAGSSRDVYVAGYAGRLLHLQRERFVPFFPALPTAALNAIWGRSADDIYAVGSQGALWRWDGSAWSALDSGTTLNLNGVWGDGAGAVYLVGAGGQVLRLEGGRAQLVAKGLITSELYAVGGSGPDDVWAVGRAGAVLRFDGKEWSAPARVVPADLRGVWASSKRLAFVVGAGGTVLRWDGAALRAEPIGSSANLWTVHGVAPDQVWVGGWGGALLFFDGRGWTPQDSGTQQLIRGIAGRAAERLFAVCDTNGIGTLESDILQRDSGGWRRLSSRTNNRLFGAWVSPRGAAYAVGGQGTILRHEP